MAITTMATTSTNSNVGDTPTPMDKLPTDIFFHMLSFVPVDGRDLAEPAFATSHHLLEAFDQRKRVLGRCRALGVHQFALPRAALARRPDYLRLMTEYNLHCEWSCSNENHKRGEFFSCDSELAKAIDPDAKGGSLLTRLHDLESLDLRGALLTVPLLTLLIEHCPQLICLKLNFASFESAEARDLFLERLAPHLRHLALDNLFLDSLEAIFEAAINLVDAQVILFPNSRTTPEIFSAIASEKLSLLSLKFFTVSRTGLSLPPAAFIFALHQSPVKESLRHIRIKSNYNYMINHDLVNELKEFRHLTSLNFDLMLYYHQPEGDFDFRGCWPQLDLISCDFYGLRGSNLLLLSILHGAFRSRLERLIIHDVRLMKRTMKAIVQLCPNIKMIKLNEVSAKHLKWIFDWLTEFPKLDSLHITFGLKVAALTGENARQAETAHHFPEEKIGLFRDLFTNHRTLTSVTITDWPGLKRAALNQALDGLSAMRKIRLYFTEY